MLNLDRYELVGREQLVNTLRKFIKISSMLQQQRSRISDLHARSMQQATCIANRIGDDAWRVTGIRAAVEFVNLVTSQTYVVY